LNRRLIVKEDFKQNNGNLLTLNSSILKTNPQTDLRYALATRAG